MGIYWVIKITGCIIEPGIMFGLIVVLLMSLLGSAAGYALEKHVRAILLGQLIFGIVGILFFPLFVSAVSCGAAGVA